jgi:hypothetical protein
VCTGPDSGTRVVVLHTFLNLSIDTSMVYLFKLIELFIKLSV